jgi:hypothetical protein
MRLNLVFWEGSSLVGKHYRFRYYLPPLVFLETLAGDKGISILYPYKLPGCPLNKRSPTIPIGIGQFFWVHLIFNCIAIVIGNHHAIHHGMSDAIGDGMSDAMICKGLILLKKS